MTIKFKDEGAPKAPAANAAPATADRQATFVQKVIRNDTYTVLSASEFLPEDEFTGLYFTTKDPSKVFIQPPYEPKYLKGLPSLNNILQQCIEAMEVNIDGTGYELVPTEDKGTIEQAEKKRIESFLNEPFPGQSFVSIRRDLRRDIESMGWGALEILRNIGGDMVGLRNLPAETLRCIRLDAPVQVTKKIERDGKEVELTFWSRERRYAQILGHNQYRYFREYGATRHLRAGGSPNIGTNPPPPGAPKTDAPVANGITFAAGTGGDWESPTNPIAPEDRASEILFFRVHPDVMTPYGVPRWINQLPSVLGSRKAEEQNLEFFDSGGMPPAIIFIEGGTLAKDTADQLRMYLSGQMKARNRAVVVEAQSSSGSLDSTGQVRTKVERFGADSTKDSMFREYDKNAEEHVRTGFRIPPLFIGKAADYSYASASTSYMVAEAQVFGPERVEFDEVVNRTIMKELKAKTCKFKSLPITLKDVATQLKALEISKGVTKTEEWVDEVNKVAGLSLQFDAEAEKLAKEQAAHGTESAKIGVEAAKVGVKQQKKMLDEPIDDEETVEKSDHLSPKGILRLANDFLVAEKLVEGKDFTVEDRDLIRKHVDALPADDRQLFNRFVAVRIQQAMV